MNRRFQDLARSSTELQHRRELFAAGLIDNPHNPRDLDESRRAHKEYPRKWSDLPNVTKTPRKMSLEYPSPGLGDPSVLGRNLVAIPPRDSDTIDFLHAPREVEHLQIFISSHALYRVPT